MVTLKVLKNYLWKAGRCGRSCDHLRVWCGWCLCGLLLCGGGCLGCSNSSWLQMAQQVSPLSSEPRCRAQHAKRSL